MVAIAKYPYGEDFQLRILSLFAKDPVFLSTNRDAAKTQYFDRAEYMTICQILCNYSDAYKAPPDLVSAQACVEDVIQRFAVNKDLASSIRSTLAYIYHLQIDDTQYVIDRVIDFARRQELKTAISKQLELLEKPDADLNDASRYVNDALMVGCNRNPGLDLGASADNLPALIAKNPTYSRRVPTLLPTVDSCLMGGLGYGEFGLFVGPAGIGKSTILANIGYGAYMSGANVFHVTLELKEIDVALKYAARHTGVEINQIIQNEPVYTEQLLKSIIPANRIKIKYISPSTADANSIRSMLSFLHSQGFHPDLLIIDYIKKMKYNRGDSYNSLGGISDQLIAIGDDFKCFTKDTKIPLLSGEELSFEELMNYNEQIWTYSYDIKRRKIVPGKASKPFKTGNKRIVKVTFDNGSSVRCTHDHLFMMRDGSYKEAAKLLPNDSLMPLCRKKEVMYKNRDYEKVYNPLRDHNPWTHRAFKKFVRFADLLNGEFVATDNPIYEKCHYGTVHHINGRFDNGPSSLLRVRKCDHTKYHSDKFNDWNNSPEGKLYHSELLTNYNLEHSSEKLTKLWETEEFRSMMMEKLNKGEIGWGMLWENDDFREMMLEKLENGEIGWGRKWKDPEWAKFRSQLSSDLLKERWATDPEFREMMSKVTARTGREKFKKLWDNPEFREKKIEEFMLMITTQVDCPECGRVCGNIGSLSLHIQQNHTTLEKVKCPECSKEYYGKHSLKLHMRRHNPDSKYKIKGSHMRINQMKSKCEHVKDKLVEAGYDPETQWGEGYKELLHEGKIWRGAPSFKSYKKYNHKVISVEEAGYEDVYDITVENYHNFAVGLGDGSGVFVHNCGVFSAQQTRRSLRWAEITELEGIADAWSLIENADVAIGLSQTKLEHKASKVRLEIGKVRRGSDVWTIPCTLDYAKATVHELPPDQWNAELKKAAEDNGNKLSQFHTKNGENS